MASRCSGVSWETAVEILRLVRLERLAVLLLHQRHAEHVELIALARALGIEHEGAGDVVVVFSRAFCFARHRLHSSYRRKVIASGSPPWNEGCMARLDISQQGRGVCNRWHERLTAHSSRSDAGFSAAQLQYSRIGLSTSSFLLQLGGRRDLRDHVDQHAVVRRLLRHVRMRPVGAPDHAVREALDDRARERHHVVVGRARDREPLRAGDLGDPGLVGVERLQPILEVLAVDALPSRSGRPCGRTPAWSAATSGTAPSRRGRRARNRSRCASRAWRCAWRCAASRPSAWNRPAA